MVAKWKKIGSKTVAPARELKVSRVTCKVWRWKLAPPSSLSSPSPVLIGTSDNTLLRAHAVARDAADPLADCRSRFSIPEDVIYLDGNSLGPLPNGVAEHVARAVTEEWGTGLIRSWNNAGWVDLPAGAGAKIARLIGAEAGNVMVTDSTSVNLFKVVSAALALRPDRQVMMSKQDKTSSYLKNLIILRNK